MVSGIDLVREKIFVKFMVFYFSVVKSLFGSLWFFGG